MKNKDDHRNFFILLRSKNFDCLLAWNFKIWNDQKVNNFFFWSYFFRKNKKQNDMYSCLIILLDFLFSYISWRKSLSLKVCIPQNEFT